MQIMQNQNILQDCWVMPLYATTCLTDLRGLLCDRLEALKGERAGQYCIRISDQWLICFAWPSDASGPSDVEIVDDH